MAGSKALTRLENKFMVLRKRQEEMQAKFKKEIKETQRAIASKRSEFILQAIRRTEFPLDKPVILIGALLEAKQKLDGPQRADSINRYIRLYNEFAAKYPDFALPDEEDSAAGNDQTEDVASAESSAKPEFGGTNSFQGVNSFGRESQS